MSITKMIKTRFGILEDGQIQVTEIRCIMEDGECISKVPHPYVLNKESKDYLEKLDKLASALSPEQKLVITELAEIIK